MLRKLIAGNWKMNGLLEDGRELARGLAERARAEEPPCELLICPPAQLLLPVAEVVAGSPVALGAQDCHAEPSGAHTGDISAVMLADVGCRFVIVGHSERRSDHGETDGLVRVKAEAAMDQDLTPIICIGETRKQRLAGCELPVVEIQLRRSWPRMQKAPLPVVAYEPVWAIGTGDTASPTEVARMHAQIRNLLREMLGDEVGSAVRILYGGSVKPGNAAELLAVPDVDGALVGGASLKLDDFWAVAASSP